MNVRQKDVKPFLEYFYVYDWQGQTGGFMTDYQETALRFPCYFAIETAQPRLSHAVEGGTLVLSINTGYE